VKTESCSHYVIEKKNQDNPIELIRASQIGEDAIQAFLALLDNKKDSLSLTNVDQKYTRAHGDFITEILSFARLSSLTLARRLPMTFLLIKYDREKRLINRSALRKAKKEKHAEDIIAAFLQRIKQLLEELEADRLAITAQNAKS
jgi:UDP-2,3-diacylglucosamine pyrophosphatase LpxH